MIIISLLEYVLQENTILVFLLKNWMFNSIYYLPLFCNYLWNLLAISDFVSKYFFFQFVIWSFFFFIIFLIFLFSFIFRFGFSNLSTSA